MYAHFDINDSNVCIFGVFNKSILTSIFEYCNASMCLIFDKSCVSQYILWKYASIYSIDFVLDSHVTDTVWTLLVLIKLWCYFISQLFNLSYTFDVFESLLSFIIYQSFQLHSWLCCLLASQLNIHRSFFSLLYKCSISVCIFCSLIFQKHVSSNFIEMHALGAISFTIESFKLDGEFAF